MQPERWVGVVVVRRMGEVGRCPSRQGARRSGGALRVGLKRAALRAGDPRCRCGVAGVARGLRLQTSRAADAVVALGWTLQGGRFGRVRGALSLPPFPGPPVVELDCQQRGGGHGVLGCKVHGRAEL